MRAFDSLVRRIINHFFHSPKMVVWHTACDIWYISNSNLFPAERNRVVCARRSCACWSKHLNFDHVVATHATEKMKSIVFSQGAIYYCNTKKNKYCNLRWLEKERWMYSLSYSERKVSIGEFDGCVTVAKYVRNTFFSSLSILHKSFQVLQ